MKPTVSEIEQLAGCRASRTWRTSGSSVTNSASDASASACVSRLNSVVLPGVGVADERDGRHRGLLTPLAQLRAAFADLFDVFGDRVNSRADAAAVGFELRLARSSGADAAAEPRQRRAGSHEPRQQVFQLRELDLQLAFARPRAPREDVENQLRAVDDLSADDLLRSAAAAPASARCRRRRRRRRSPHRTRRASSIFPAPRKVEGSGFGPLLQDAQHDLRAGGLGQPGEFVERALGLETTRASGDEADERRASRRRYARWAHACTSSHDTAPGANQSQLRAGDVHNRRRRTARRRAGIEQQIETAAELSPRPRPDRRSAGWPLMFALVAVSGRPNARTQRARDRMRGHANADRPCRRRSRPAPASRGARITSVSGPGQKRVGEPVRRRSHLTDPLRAPGRRSAATSGSARSAVTSLDREHARDGSRIERIDGEAVERIGGNRDDAAIGGATSRRAQSPSGPAERGSTTTRVIPRR